MDQLRGAFSSEYLKILLGQLYIYAIQESSLYFTEYLANAWHKIKCRHSYSYTNETIKANLSMFKDSVSLFKENNIN